MNYNANGVRTSKIKETPSFNGINLETTNYTYDSEGRLRRETRNAFERIYLYSSDGIIGYEEEGEKFLYRKNLFGDVTAIYQGTTKVAEYVYDAWGNCTITYDPDGYGASNPIRYRGYYWDRDIKMYYLMTRYYDPKTGRFINADTPNYLDPETLGGLNLYSYCKNNPVMCVDPIGHEPLSIALSMLGEFIVPLALLALLGIAIALVVKKTKELQREKVEKVEKVEEEKVEEIVIIPFPNKPIDKKDPYAKFVPVILGDTSVTNESWENIGRACIYWGFNFSQTVNQSVAIMGSNGKNNEYYLFGSRIMGASGGALWDIICTRLLDEDTIWVIGSP